MSDHSDLLRRLRDLEYLHTSAVCPELREEAADAIEALQTDNAALVLQAQGHAQEARTANATIAEIYQLSTGATGEPGNWNGAEPVRKALGERDALRQENAALYRFARLNGHGALEIDNAVKAAMREGKP